MEKASTKFEIIHTALQKEVTSSIYRPCASWQVFPGPGIIDG